MTQTNPWILCLAGAVVGMAGTLYVMSGMLGIEQPVEAAITSHDEGGEVIESFYIGSADGIAVDHDGNMIMGTFPPSIRHFEGEALANTAAFMLKLRDKTGTVVGFSSELEVFPPEDIVMSDVVWETIWTLVIPGRGSLYLHQQEHSGDLGPKIVIPMRESGKDWVGDFTTTTTVGPREDGRGVILGGTGEFEGLGGSFVEIDHVTGFSSTGVMTGEFEIRLFKEARS